MVVSGVFQFVGHICGKFLPHGFALVPTFLQFLKQREQFRINTIFLRIKSRLFQPLWQFFDRCDQPVGKKQRK